MSDLKISPSKLTGKFFIPPSKSHTMRALILGSLGSGKTEILNYLDSPDTHFMIQAMRSFGVRIEVFPEKIEMSGRGGQLEPSEDVIDAGNSGQILRFVASLAALLPTYTVITGDHSIRYNRPVSPLLSGLNQLKAFATSTRLNNHAPLIVRGPMQPGHAEVVGEDSQPISALLMAASFLSGTTHLHVLNPGETPWIDLTLSWIKKVGGSIQHQSYKRYTINGSLVYDGFHTIIPGDFSSAAFPLVAALITKSSLTLENIDLEDIQGDKKIIEILAKMGARFDIDSKKRTLTVCHPSHLTGMKIDANEIIDALPILAVVGCFASGTTEIVNAAIARKKESDRIHAIATELRKMGALIEEKEDGLIISQSSLKGACMFSHADHRIAMALAIAALGAEGDSFISEMDCISKSYPPFISDFQKAGGLFWKI